MISRERVLQVINHGRPDRIPLYAWVFLNLERPLTEKFGSVAAFEDHYEFDVAHLFSDCLPYQEEEMLALRRAKGPITPTDLLEMEPYDVNDMGRYQSLVEGIRHHKEARGRWVYVQTPGIFEVNNIAFASIEDHLLYLAMYPEELRLVYQRQAEWNRQFALNCLDLGVDMIHVSDDWGSQSSLLFSPRTWWELIYPYHKITCDAVKARGGHLSLHSDGNVMSVLDGIVQLGYDVIHPYQESAGMDLGVFKNQYRDKFSMMGGLCVQTTIGFGKMDFLKAEIERILRMFADGGLIYCTSHFIQDHCTIEELTEAFDYIYDFIRT